MPAFVWAATSIRHVSRNSGTRPALSPARVSDLRFVARRQFHWCDPVDNAGFHSRFTARLVSAAAQTLAQFNRAAAMRPFLWTHYLPIAQSGAILYPSRRPERPS